MFKGKVLLHQAQFTILSVDWPTLCYCCWLMWHVSCCCHDYDAELIDG